MTIEENSMKMLPNGNIEITVALLPEAYAALMSARERDKTSVVDTVNVALMSHNMVSEMATKAGAPLAAAMDEPSESTPAPAEGDPVNSGHGHVRPRRDGLKARCGGPGLCSECSIEQQAQANSTT